MLTLALDIADIDPTTGLSGDFISRKLDESDESVMLLAYAAPLDGRTASFGRTAAMFRESFAFDRNPRRPSGDGAFGAEKEEEEAEQGEWTGSGKEGEEEPLGALKWKDKYVIGLEVEKPPWVRRTSA